MSEALNAKMDLTESFTANMGLTESFSASFSNYMASGAYWTFDEILDSNDEVYTFTLVRQSVAYDSSGVLVNASIPVYETV